MSEFREKKHRLHFFSNILSQFLVCVGEDGTDGGFNDSFRVLNAEPILSDF